MAQWLVTQGNQQFSVEGLDELEALARQGRLSAGDMIQPPGTSEWMYVSEVEELATILGASGGSAPDFDDDLDYRRSSSVPFGAVAAALVVLIVLGGGAMFFLAQQLPTGAERLIGAGGLNYSQMIVTEKGSGLRADPSESAGFSQSLPKDSVLELLSKRGEWYRARGAGGTEGWIPASQVIPMYMLGGADVRDEFDPLYNPDRYVDVMNATWMQLPAENPRPGRELSNVTVFEFLMKNSSVYPMTDLVIQATIKDAKGHELETLEIPVEGMIPAEGHTMVGTLDVEEGEPRLLTAVTFQEMAELDPDLQLRWKDGVEVEMDGDGEFTSAEIDIVELRAVPDEDASQVVRRDD